MSEVGEIAEAVKKTAEEIGPSIVGLGHRWAIGSGVVIAEGRVLTNAHNLRRDSVTVTFADGRTAEGRTVGVDVDGDIAVLEVDTGDAPAIGWDGASADLSIGSPVLALANPGGRGLRVTFGLVSGTERAFRGPRGRRITGSVEHTAPLLPGSSGGAIVDIEGKLRGINTNRLGEGFYLAIPADADLRSRVDALSKGESPRRARLGIGIAPSEVAKGLRRAVGLEELDGLLVRAVEEGSPAESAGLQEGDLLVEAGGRKLASFDDLHEVLNKGGKLEIKLVRGVEERSVTVEPSED